MSSTQDSRKCPNCGGKEMLETYFENRPFENVFGECLKCGFFYYTVGGQMSLNRLNEMRKNNGLRPLKKLSKVKKTLRGFMDKEAIWTRNCGGR